MTTTRGRPACASRRRKARRGAIRTRTTCWWFLGVCKLVRVIIRSLFNLGSRRYVQRLDCLKFRSTVMEVREENLFACLHSFLAVSQYCRGLINYQYNIEVFLRYPLHNTYTRNMGLQYWQLFRPLHSVVLSYVLRCVQFNLAIKVETVPIRLPCLWFFLLHTALLLRTVSPKP